ncbi:hypothetical protein COY87_01240 [Candidatus Roizmanbacteria bacterium CG_4_10_14_0_8_um_filter_33_9]|uniref:Uncharacterized protein n=1 Tax=Candidatus Roizmanbacteria bacterium CG_4_10_14_0_8_um_filter_33_9 TaxID=1974826 RepID=A0A2M7QJ67_9BACT|nr:MAG: hypothetical protein COY87_01240 [Candidatus Roizmanbacteria bacterium CG_4_10_14_0_8_um_filter_33_9]
MKKITLIFYILLIFILAFYSYALIDPNITFFQHPLWVMFRDPLVQFGYYNREGSWWTYFILVILLFLFSFFAVRFYKKINIVKLSCVIGGILLFSYPFLSHDFFNYMFDARILTYYGKNPYLFKALDFPADKWTRFMHWTHRTYPYGPIFLILSLVPSFLGFGKFTLTFILFKATFIGLYIISVVLLSRLNKKWAVMFATHPLIIIEGLVSSHNDMVALSFAIIGIYFLYKNKNKWGRILFLLSLGIKYLSFPVFFVRAPIPKGFLSFLKNIKNKILNHSSKTLLDRLRNNQNVMLFALQIGIILYVSFVGEIQPWYFLGLLAFTPFLSEFINKLWIFFFGLLISYYPYIRFGGWDTVDKVNLKHLIIIIFFGINLLYFFLYYFRLKKVKA